jgi:hypothetical protein
MSRYIYIGQGVSGNVFATYWEATNSTSGIISPPAGSTLKQDAFQDLEDALVSTIQDGKPTFNAAVDSEGMRVVASMDSSGAYILSPAPSVFPVALIYRVVIPEQQVDWNSPHLVVEDVERPGGGGFSVGQNVGAGAGVFKQVSGAQLQFRTLVAGSNVNITQNTDTISISATGGGGSGGSGNGYFPGGW